MRMFGVAACILLGVGCGGGTPSAPGAPVPITTYNGSWTGHGAQWTIDNIRFTVDGQRITAMTLSENLYLDPIVNLGGGRFAVSCRRDFTLAEPATFTGSQFTVSLRASDVPTAITVRGTFSSPTTATGSFEAFSAPSACGYSSTGTVYASTWTASRS